MNTHNHWPWDYATAAHRVERIGDAALYLGDCLEVMRGLPDASVDMLLCDLPYGTTDCKWDAVIPFHDLWGQYRRLVKPSGAIVLTCAQPFTTALIASNYEDFRYEIVWDKVNRNTGYGNANKMPLRRHENIAVFYRKLPTYNPQMTSGDPYVAKRSGRKPGVYANGGLDPQNGINEGTRYPVSILPIKADIKTEMGLHPTQKPVALMEYLIRTYTNEGELVLDNTMGSGTTGVAALRAGRRFVGIERDENYFGVACQRISEAKSDNSPVINDLFAPDSVDTNLTQHQNNEAQHDVIATSKPL